MWHSLGSVLLQQRKLREEMKDIVKQKATQSAYPALSRQDKRVAEFHHDRLTQEQSLQKDTKKAERLARRIAQILDQLRKDFNKIKNFRKSINLMEWEDTYATTRASDVMQVRW